MKRAFDLILSFDDVITQGYRESVQQSQLDAFLEMDSTDEKIYKIQQAAREAEAKEQAKRQQKEIAKRRLEAQPSDKILSMSSADIQKQQVETTPFVDHDFKAPDDTSKSPLKTTTTTAPGSGMFGAQSAETTELGGGKGQGG